MRYNQTQPRARVAARSSIVLAFVTSFLGCAVLSPVGNAEPMWPTPADSNGYLYRVTLIRAAPGSFGAFIAEMQSAFQLLPQQGDERPLWMRHTQGDQWDFMILFPMKDAASFYHPDRVRERELAGQPWNEAWNSATGMVAWSEDIFAHGPDLETLRHSFDAARFFHVEMFEALPGRLEELIRQRHMENVYLAGIERPTNFIFVRESGGSSQVFTLGCYRDIKHFAESADVLLEDEERAARAAGFDGVNDISPYLRSLIARHHDTLAVAID